MKLVILVSAVGHRIPFDLKTFLAPDRDGFPLCDLLGLVLHPIFVGCLCQRFGAAAEGFAQPRPVRQFGHDAEFPAVATFSESSFYKKPLSYRKKV